MSSTVLIAVLTGFLFWGILIAICIALLAGGNEHRD